MPQKLSRHRKRFGQIFLRDSLVIEKILQHADLSPDDTVLEIGPGRGALTAALGQQVSRLYAIEIEAPFAEALRQRFAARPHVHILQADARTYNYGQLPAPLTVVANLPYSMGLPILRQLFAHRHHLSRLIIMLQREVAARLLAPPGTRAYGALSVFFQYYATLRCCFGVSRHAFVPVPAVDSTVLSLVPYTILPWPSHNEPFFFSLVKRAFAHRRKMLRANLLAMPQCLTKAELEDILSNLHLSTNVRPQELSVSQFVQLATTLHGLLADREASRGREL
ncbi:Ribosomal RNA small subunit methyltransferase A [Candidatus Entotheonellaceae bacterium PAL068K]